MADFEPKATLLEIEVPEAGPIADVGTDLEPAFEDLMRELYPHGRAWSEDPRSVTYDVLGAIAAVAIEVELQVQRFKREADPTSTYELLAEWEAALRLPDPCLGLGANIDSRRAAIVSKLVGLQGASESEIVAFLLSLGYVVVLGHFKVCRTETWQIAEPILSPAWQFAFSITYWGSGDRTRLECALKHRLPAHVSAVFYYGDHTPQPAELVVEVPPLWAIN